MPPPYHIDPDHFLPMSGEGNITREEGRAAWEKAYAFLEDRLKELGPTTVMYVVYGIQGSGKTTWVNSNASLREPNAIFFSGPLPGRVHRSRALAIAHKFGCKTIAVWVNVPLEIALARNARRQGAARIPEDIIRYVLESLTPASIDEGFSEVIEINGQYSEA